MKKSQSRPTNKYNVYNDAIPFRRRQVEGVAGSIKPRYLFGTNEQFPVDIVKWKRMVPCAPSGTGWDRDFEERDNYEESMKLLKGEWKDGRWYDDSAPTGE